jgi:myo-inositol-1(or 4)-monophosphatase
MPVDITELEAARDLAVRLAIEAGVLQVRTRGSITGLTTKAHANDLVSDVDIASERLIVDGILAAYPADGIFGEEGNRVDGTSGRLWVIDPLDGTRNYLTGAGPWSVSIALREGGNGLVGVVHDPLLGETFGAVAGAGATLNSQPIRVTDADSLGKAIVGLCFQPSPETKRQMAGIISGLLPVIGDIRRIPAAVCLCYLAAGRFDGCLVVDTQSYDVAAGELIAREAGAVLGGVAGKTPNELTVGSGAPVWDEFAAVLGPLIGTVSSFG